MESATTGSCSLLYYQTSNDNSTTTPAQLINKLIKPR